MCCHIAALFAARDAFARTASRASAAHRSMNALPAGGDLRDAALAATQSIVAGNTVLATDETPKRLCDHGYSSTFKGS